MVKLQCEINENSGQLRITDSACTQTLQTQKERGVTTTTTTKIAVTRNSKQTNKQTDLIFNACVCVCGYWIERLIQHTNPLSKRRKLVELDTKLFLLHREREKNTNSNTKPATDFKNVYTHFVVPLRLSYVYVCVRLSVFFLCAGIHFLRPYENRFCIESIESNYSSRLWRITFIRYVHKRNAIITCATEYG